MSKRRGCVKAGCIGCAGVVGIFVMVMVVLGVGAVMQDRSTAIEQRELVQAVPRIDLPADDPSQATSDDLRQPNFRFDRADPGDPGTVDLRLSTGQFQVVPGPAGEPIRVEGDYDTNRYTLEQTYEPAAAGRGWVYKVRFAPKGLFKLFNFGPTTPPEVRVILPRDSPFALKGKISMGESDIELGGLWLTSVDLEAGMGEHSIGFAEPTLMPIQQFTVDGSMGALHIDNLGNASPQTASIKLSMGELQLDLGGPWAQDAEVQVRTSMGEADIRVPEGVNVDVKRASVGVGERNIRGLRDRAQLPGAATLHLDATHSMGELRIR